MLVTFFTTICLSLLACVAAPQKRAKAEVVYSCTKPNTVALTFVSELPYFQNIAADDLQDDGAWVYL